MRIETLMKIAAIAFDLRSDPATRKVAQRTLKKNAPETWRQFDPRKTQRAESSQQSSPTSHNDWYAELDASRRWKTTRMPERKGWWA